MSSEKILPILAMIGIGGICFAMCMSAIQLDQNKARLNKEVEEAKKNKENDK